MKSEQVGVLLANLGTPAQPNTSGVRAFLAQFLHDKRVVDLSRWLWCPLLHGIILPLRSPKVAKLYQSIWMEEGSPLMVYSKRQRDKLSARLNIPVELGMTYGEPSVEQGLKKLLDQGVTSVKILPLYPQYSGSTTGAVFDAVAKVFMNCRIVPDFNFIRDYYSHPLYIRALASSVKEYWEKHGKGDYLLCSYHGIPQRYADNGDIYPAHCEQTTRLLAKELGLDNDKIGHSYQSRFGREEWMKPYTDETLQLLPEKGIQNLDIISPAFSVDCLETLEEIAEQGKSQFLEAGGKSYQFIPCLNDSDLHIDMMQSLIEAL
ncbi:ferrochelatase [Vibrio salinus]|uniref:ferrochelatase n=1 Tax=Vibrio salinus TaxID=2899784 RepID=UPI001E2D2642|nr:ferrochelatase [Vibrio salinus]MCE0492988.1 ferrochelatase [Vibrio salinus]